MPIVRKKAEAILKIQYASSHSEVFGFWEMWNSLDKVLILSFISFKYENIIDTSKIISANDNNIF